MDQRVTEASYPLSFRQDEAQKLGEYIKQRQSVNLVGMKRVGIGNFLRFFLYHQEIVKTYISNDEKHLFIAVDLNDLVEREIYPFWTLVLKRIVDAVETTDLPDETKKKINTLFLTSIQSHDLFLVIDSIRHSLSWIAAGDIYPTLFFIRFDRLKDVITTSFFDNLEGLRDATHERASYVFTSFRSLDVMFPQIKNRLPVFAQVMPIRPAKESDMAIIYESYEKRYNFQLSPTIEKSLFRLVNGNVQYLQLALIVMNEKKSQKITTEEELLEMLLTDERITLESEELWESLTKEEKQVVLPAAKGQQIQANEKAKALYLWDAGFITDTKDGLKIFSPLLEHYLIGKEKNDKKSQLVDLTRKEHLLFSLLESQIGEICEREKIIEVVWPEYQEFGVSDWAIDRLVARVRVKLRQQNSPYEIVTVRTRGYKLSIAKE